MKARRIGMNLRNVKGVDKKEDQKREEEGLGV